MLIDFNNPVLMTAVIVGTLAFLGAIVAALIGRKKAPSSIKEQEQKAVFSRDITQIQAGRDLKVGAHPLDNKIQEIEKD